MPTLGYRPYATHDRHLPVRLWPTTMLSSEWMDDDVLRTLRERTALVKKEEEWQHFPKQKR